MDSVEKYTKIISKLLKDNYKTQIDGSIVEDLSSDIAQEICSIYEEENKITIPTLEDHLNPLILNYLTDTGTWVCLYCSEPKELICKLFDLINSHQSSPPQVHSEEEEESHKHREEEDDELDDEEEEFVRITPETSHKRDEKKKEEKTIENPLIQNEYEIEHSNRRKQKKIDSSDSSKVRSNPYHHHQSPYYSSSSKMSDYKYDYDHQPNYYKRGEPPLPSFVPSDQYPPPPYMRPPRLDYPYSHFYPYPPHHDLYINYTSYPNPPRELISPTPPMYANPSPHHQPHRPPQPPYPKRSEKQLPKGKIESPKIGNEPKKAGAFKSALSSYIVNPSSGETKQIKIKDEGYESGEIIENEKGEKVAVSSTLPSPPDNKTLFTENRQPPKIPKRKNISGGKKFKRLNQIQLKNIPPELNNISTINGFFQEFGKITNVNVDQARRSAIIKFATMDDAQRARECPPPFLGNSNIILVEDTPEEKQKEMEEKNANTVYSISGNKLFESESLIKKRKMKGLEKDYEKYKKEHMESCTSQIQSWLKYMKDNKDKLNEEQKEEIYQNIDKLNEQLKALKALSQTEDNKKIKSNKYTNPQLIQAKPQNKPSLQNQQIILSHIPESYQSYPTLQSLLAKFGKLANLKFLEVNKASLKFVSPIEISQLNIEGMVAEYTS